MTARKQDSAQRVAGLPILLASGGGAMQHVHGAGLWRVKQRTLEDNLWHLGRRPKPCCAPSKAHVGLPLPCPTERALRGQEVGSWC